jgi:glutathione S-transferase
MRVGGFRKAAKCPYPTPYASSESIATAVDAKDKKAKYLFNCAQRAHGNFMENYPAALAGLLIAGVQYPVASSVAGVAWMVSRVFYAVGYTDPAKEMGKGRFYGKIPRPGSSLDISCCISLSE